jgi:ABC-type molybdenum transport system ATPase subunit/photorepair protein PhrA
VKAHENPYRVSRVETLRFRGSEPVAQLADTVRSHSYRGAIVGPEGSGKSTLLRELADSIAADGIRVRVVRFDGVAALASALVDRDTVWLVDGAERIPPPIRATLAKLVRRIVITAHHETSYLPLLALCDTDLALLDDLLAELAGPTAGSDVAEALFRESGGNLRLVFQALYDAAAQDFAGAFRARYKTSV